MRPEASWRKMLIMLPPPREIWNYSHEGGKFIGSSNVERCLNPKSKGYPTDLGELYEAISLEAERCCLRTRTFLRISERYHVALQIDVEIKQIDSQKDDRENRSKIVF